MILAEALEFSKQFPHCQPKIFKGFVEWKNCSVETHGYVVLTTLANQSFSTQMENYIKSHKLRVEQIKNYWMICTQI
jgi:glycerol-3-phosphate dehydrogenase